MKLALREDMSRGGTLAEQVAWLDGLGFEGIELSAAALDLAPRELEEIFAALNEAGYDGYLGIECRISGPTTRRWPSQPRF
jgi:sugar phosphate isomerase/epimerase